MSEQKSMLEFFEKLNIITNQVASYLRYLLVSVHIQHENAPFDIPFLDLFW